MNVPSSHVPVLLAIQGSVASSSSFYRDRKYLWIVFSFKEIQVPSKETTSLGEILLTFKQPACIIIALLRLVYCLEMLPRWAMWSKSLLVIIILKGFVVVPPNGVFEIVNRCTPVTFACTVCALQRKLFQCPECMPNQKRKHKNNKLYFNVH